MFVAFVPAAIDDFSIRRVIICAFEICVLGGFSGLRLIGRTRERIVLFEANGIRRNARHGSWGIGAIIEEEAVVWSKGVVDDEVVEIIMLFQASATIQLFRSERNLREV